LNEIEYEILRSAHHINKHWDQGHNDGGWFKPMHVGGTDASPHSGVLRRMCRQGLMEKRRWGRAFAYRITKQGLAALNKADGVKIASAGHTAKDAS
jgi:hypothetical protein